MKWEDAKCKESDGRKNRSCFVINSLKSKGAQQLTISNKLIRRSEQRTALHDKLRSMQSVRSHRYQFKQSRSRDHNLHSPSLSK